MRKPDYIPAHLLPLGKGLESGPVSDTKDHARKETPTKTAEHPRRRLKVMCHNEAVSHTRIPKVHEASLSLDKRFDRRWKADPAFGIA